MRVQKTPNLDTIEREKRHAMVIGRKGAKVMKD
jgi:hypothetical protein